MNVIPQDCAASTALMRGAPSAVTARRVTLLKQTSVPARLQVRGRNVFKLQGTGHLYQVLNNLNYILKKRKYF